MDKKKKTHPKIHTQKNRRSDLIMELGTEKETRGILWGEGGNLEGCISYFFEESKILTENSSDTVEI